MNRVEINIYFTILDVHSSIHTSVVIPPINNGQFKHPEFLYYYLGFLVKSSLHNESGHGLIFIPKMSDYVS